jgi:glucose/arabinose dehydrogenase
MLRIDVDRKRPYAIPAGNPFTGRSGVRPEIYAYGFRNPWRYSFDPCDGKIMLGDVGHGAWEEINSVVAGGNFGWKRMEGDSCFRPRVCDPADYQKPIHVYGHLGPDDMHGGNAVVGGYVYRGRRIPALVGHYLFTDHVSARLWSLTPVDSSGRKWKRQELLKLDFTPSSFGLAEDGEIYIVGYDGTIHALSAIDGS